MRRYLPLSLVALIVAVGCLAGVSSRPNAAEAQPAALQLGALCVHTSTRIVSGPTNITGTTCPAAHFPLLIPDSLPFTLTLNPYTGVVYFMTTPTPGFPTITLPNAGNIPFCMNLYTRTLRYGANCTGSTFLVVLVAELAPTAADDGPYTIPVTTPLNVPAPGLLTNDDLGLPAATVISFGGGDLGGDASSNPVGTPLIGGLAGGDLSVNADGSFSLTNPTIPGDYSFDYRLTNAAGSDDATVTLQVQQLPDAMDDGLYTTLEGVTLAVMTSAPDDLLDNDELGHPAAELVSFGGGSLAGDASTNLAGTSVALAGGSLTVNANGSFEVLNPTTADEYTFQYRLENAAGSDVATVTIQVQRVPDAVNDTVTAALGNWALFPPGILGNDDQGFPSTGVDSFGGGAVPGDATANPAGTAVPFAGGTIQINANGSLNLVGTTMTGEYTVDYRLENAAGFDDATVTIQIEGPPGAVDDGSAADSAPGDLFHTAINTTLDATATPGDDNLLSNDELGFPEGDIASFGGGALGGPVTTNLAGATVSPLVDYPDGSLTVNADGSFSFTPPTNFTGEYSFDYRLTNSAGSSDATVTIAVGARPSAMDDSYTPTVLGNVSIDTSTSSLFTVLDNDSGDLISFTTMNLTSTQGGEVTLNNDGTFSYDPFPGFEGNDSFDYSVDNGFNDPQTGTVSLTVSGMIWFIDDSASAGGDGRLSAPFDCLVGAGCFDPVAADDPGDSIFLASGAYTGGLTLLGTQALIGEGLDQPLSSLVTLPPDSPSLPATDGVNPEITTSDADAVILGTENIMAGLTIGNTGTGTAISGTNFIVFGVFEVTISGTGQALDLTTGNLLGIFESIASTNAAGAGISLVGIGGGTPVHVEGTTTITNPSGDGIAITNSPNTFSFFGLTTVTGAGDVGIDLDGGNGTITFSDIDLDGNVTHALRITNNTNAVNIAAGTIDDATASGGNTVDIDGGTADVTLAASVTKTTGPDAVEVTGRTGGTVTVSGAVSCTATCSGINVSSNTSGTTVFSGQVTLDTSGNTAANMDANDSHTVRFSGGLDIDTTSGTGFDATTSGIVEVLNGSVTNTVDSTTGTAVNISNVTIGAQDVTFEHVSKNGGSTSAIVLASTGAGDFLITGTGNPGTGGTIENITNSDAVRLSNTGGLVSFSDLTIEDITATTDGSDAIQTRSGVDAIHGEVVSGGLTIDNVTIRRISDNAIYGAQLADGITPTTWSGLQILNSTLELTNRFNVSDRGDDADEGVVRILGMTGTVNVQNSTFRDGGSGLDFLSPATAGTLDITLQGSIFEDLYKEFASGTPINIGQRGVSVVLQGNHDAIVRIGDPAELNAALGNTFTNNFTASIVVAGHPDGVNQHSGDIDVVISHNDFIVSDHLTAQEDPGNLTFDIPQGGVVLNPVGGTYEAIVSNNLFDQVMMTSADGFGQLTLGLEGGDVEAIVRGNTFELPWDTAMVVRAEGTSSAAVLLDNNTWISGFVGSTSDDVGFPVQSPFQGLLVNVLDGGQLDLTVRNEDLPLHDSANTPFEETLEIEVGNNAGNLLNLHLADNTAPFGYGLTRTNGTFNLYQGAGNLGDTPAQVIDANGNTGGGGSAATDPPTVVVSGTITISPTAPTLPVVTIS